MRIKIPMIVTSAAALCLIVSFAPATARAQGRIRRNEPRPAIYRSPDGIWLLDLPPAMEDALDRYNRDFDAWTVDDYRGVTDYQPSPRQVPWAVIGDFNGDGREDVALAGRTDRDLVVVFLLSSGRSRYRAIEAEREPYDPDDRLSIRVPTLTYLYPGRYVVDDPRLPYPRQLIVDQPAVQITGGRRQGAVVYVVQNNMLVPYYLSDRTAPPVPPGSRPGVRTAPVKPRPTTGNSANPSH